MMRLGHWLLVSFQQGKVETRLDQDKACRWLEELMEIFRTKRCSPALASKFAGRFSWAATMQNDKIGRAHIREWYVATNDPLPLGALRHWHKLSCRWWVEYLKARPRAIHWTKALARRHAIMWTDAAGATRWMAAVIVFANKFYWTRWKCSDEVWNLLTEREDNQIGVQEAMAVVLGLFSWLTWLDGAAKTIYVDNEGVRYPLISGTSKGKEIALMVARMWHEAAVQRWGLLF